MANQVQQFEERISSHRIKLENTLTELENNVSLLNTVDDTPRLRNQCGYLLYQVTELRDQSVILCGRLVIICQHIDNTDAVNLSTLFEEQCQSFNIRINGIMQTMRNKLQLNRTILDNSQLKQESRYRRIVQKLRKRFSCV